MQKKEIIQCLLNLQTCEYVEKYFYLILLINADDNGVIDGDIITLIDNDKIIFENVLLSNSPIKYHITNSNTSIHNILFYAVNMGEIPPNTGLLVIRTKSKKIESNFSSDFVHSSLIRLILNK